MSKAITVKVATPKVIKALEARLIKLEKDYTSQEELETKYQKAIEKWRKEVSKWAITNYSKAENIRINYRQWNNILNIDFDINTKELVFPIEPQKDFEIIAEYKYSEMKEEIRNALSILRMTDELTVNTSTMNQIAKYL